MENLNRRDALKLGAWATAGLALSGCSNFARQVAGRKVPEGAFVPAKNASNVHQFLDRIGFGATPGDHMKVASLGYETYINEQLSPTDEDEPALQFQISRLDVYRVSAAELRDLPEAEIIRQLRQGAILRAIYSRWQLQERMVDFWTNHFNIYAFKGDLAFQKGADDLEVIRKNALGNFAEMVIASSHSAAMLGYLDNRANRKGLPNENYARELLELHTLGVNGGYTQKDVQEVARCFTGWSVENRFLRPKDRFRFEPEFHDDGEKVVLGVKIPAGGGASDGEKVIEIVTKHPSCAKFISQKLCRYFLGEAGNSLVPVVAAEFTKTNGDIKATLKPILLSPLMLSGQLVVKRPFDFVISSCRSLNAGTDGGKGIQFQLDTMGQSLFDWPMPDGYPDKTSAWTGSLLPRWNFVWALTQGQIEGTSIDFAAVDGRIGDFVLGVSGAGGTTAEHAAIALIDPRFNWR